MIKNKQRRTRSSRAHHIQHAARAQRLTRHHARSITLNSKKPASPPLVVCATNTAAPAYALLVASATTALTPSAAVVAVVSPSPRTLNFNTLFEEPCQHMPARHDLPQPRTRHTPVHPSPPAALHALRRHSAALSRAP